MIIHGTLNARWMLELQLDGHGYHSQYTNIAAAAAMTIIVLLRPLLLAASASATTTNPSHESVGKAKPLPVIL